jgi:two-component system response regulator FlrC
LGKLVLGKEESLISQVSDSDSRCLAASSSSLLKILNEAESMALSGRPILIMGETGVGKELLARFIHQSSGRHKFVPISLAQVRGDTAISELFGHSPGAFTGAMSRRAGAFLEAGNGTLFLDEITEVQDHIAAALLRAIEEKRVKPLGLDNEIEAPARIIAATNRPDKLRHDLFYRFTHRIMIPPLRERPDDIGAIARFIAFRDGFEISEKALTALKFISPWKGNARELEYVILQARNGSRSPVLGLKNLMEAMHSPMSCWEEHQGSGIREIRKTLGMSLREFAQVVGVPKSSLADMEKRGMSGKSDDVIRALCSYLENLPDAKATYPGARQGGSRVKEELQRFIEEE